ncbi:phosphotransferase [Nocardiopsis dassonvillei]|uniref:phosphotransferase n=1 Tax=Nocardiopsis dassonvillei TaxID=2014 RepID=UPI00366D5868
MRRALTKILDRASSFEQVLRQISEAFGFRSPFSRLERLAGGIENRVWRVWQNEDEYVVRIHTARREPHLSFEGQLLEALRGRVQGLEVPHLLRSTSGGFGVRTSNGAVASLQPYIESSGSAQSDLSLADLEPLVNACKVIHALDDSLQLKCPPPDRWDGRLIDLAEHARLAPALTPVVRTALKEMVAQGAVADHKLVLSHADVTPNNVLVDELGKPKALVDFDDAAWCPELFDAAVMARSFAFRSDGRIDIGRLRSIWSLWKELNSRYAFDTFLSSLTYACLRMSLLVADAVGAGVQDWKKLEDTRRWRALIEMDK